MYPFNGKIYLIASYVHVVLNTMESSLFVGDHLATVHLLGRIYKQFFNIYYNYPYNTIYTHEITSQRTRKMLPSPEH